ncbi:TPM domain-containing protein [Microbacterium sp. NPDC089189]|uniref:TPM domain-containing protein n=1 Tax=Microbacterium sp. NPDC089189 TaxID=3154972 RepID=UPI00342CB676
MRPRWAVVLVAAIVAVLWGAGPVWAAPPPSLGSSYVLDESAVLGQSELNAAEARLEELVTATGLDLWVVYVDRFSDPASAEDWANDTATQNGLGPSQYLLAVAVDDRQFYLSGDTSGPLSADQLTAIEQQHILPALREDDWAGVVDAAADGITEASRGGSVTTPTDGGSEGSGVDAGVIVLVVSVVALIGVAAFFVVRARRRRRATAPAESTEALGQRAAAALVQTDDAIRRSEQEVGFAAAQFGDAATAGFAEAIAASRAELDQAFALRQQLDDEIPDSDAQTRAWHEQTLELSRAASERLDAQTAAFDELRQLEKDAPAALTALQTERASAGQETDAADAAMASLTHTYSPAALTTVADNASESRKRLSLADAQLSDAAAALAAGSTGPAAVAIRAAQEAVAQARQLAGAVRTLGEQLASAAAALGPLRAEVERDIAAASALADPDGRLDAAVAVARAELGADAASDPIGGLQRLQTADQQLDELLQAARDAAARREHARQLLPAALAQAEAQITAAEDFIASRRGAIGATARTRLADARASFAVAQQSATSAPEDALTAAQRASRLAADATSSAQSDVAGFAPSGGDDLGGLLGGILIGSMLGGSRGGGFGGSRGGSRGFSSGGSRGGFSSGGSRSRSGGFSGGGRSRRGGGRF